MYETKWYERLRVQIREADEERRLRGKEILLLQVELGLYLLEYLDLRDEPITVLWVLLSALPIPDSRLEQLDVAKRRALAKARHLLPFSGRFSWEDALRRYALLPEEWRCYDVRLEQLNTQIVDTTRIAGRFDERLSAYDSCLGALLPFRASPWNPARPGRVSFAARTRQGMQEVSLELPEEITAFTEIGPPSFGAPRERQPLSITQDMLRTAATELDRRNGNPGWVQRLEEVIRYCVIQPNGSLGPENAETLKLEGMAHIAGMVGAGKSTLMKLIAAHAVISTELRVTLVVGDTTTALHLADEFNKLLASDPTTPVAVAILGRTTRDTHLKRLYQSREFYETHSALRWLNIPCPLQGFISVEQLGTPIIPGHEPCERLKESPPAGNLSRPTYKSCPLFPVCPSQQLYRDLPAAQIWITTPGALAESKIPLWVDGRRLKVGDFVYEHSDIVVFDEVDTIQEWFDNTYAPAEQLVDPKGKGLLDKTDVHTAEKWISQRTSPERRWILALRQSVAATSNVLSQLVEIAILQSWFGRGYFTALSLFDKLSRRLVGLPDYAADGEDLDRLKRAAQVFEYFSQLIEHDPSQYSYLHPTL